MHKIYKDGSGVKPKVGQQISTWFSDAESGLSTIMDVRPYTGKFKTDYTWIIRVTAPRTVRGWMEMSIR
jgi:hypothetical protein